ncbi:MAG TPA: MFS transporter [Longimicrobiaceae bacterium]|nr:MFS transporter [Longimicrobiaceae bacterium]
MPNSTEKLPVREKVGYALGDTAANFVFQTMIILQLAFYTDTFGITAAAAGTLLLVVRFWDAIFDPIMGVIADRTSTRWGKFRPWILWTAVPFGIMGFLTFATPDLSPTGKLIYAYVTYILLMTVYSANNLPYSALSGVMTGDVAERTSLSQYRFFFAMLAQLVIQMLALPMVDHFGHGNSALGYKVTMGIFGALAIVFFLITFASTRERIHPPPNQESNVRKDFADLLRNGPWKAMFALTIILFITLAMRGSVVVYYFRYFVSGAVLTDFVAGLPAWVTAVLPGDPATVGFSLFNGLGTIATIVGVVLSKPLAVAWGKRNLFIVGLCFTVVFTFVFLFFPPQALGLMFGAEILRQFAYGFTIPLLWAMMADVADFSEWRSGRRATGVVFSAIVFGLKAGLGVGGALAAYVLSLFGYVPNVAQTARALHGIVYSMSIFPAITFAICVVILFFYKINKGLEIEITEDLARRRREYELTPLPTAP